MMQPKPAPPGRRGILLEPEQVLACVHDMTTQLLWHIERNAELEQRCAELEARIMELEKAPDRAP